MVDLRAMNCSRLPTACRHEPSTSAPRPPMCGPGSPKWAHHPVAGHIPTTGSRICSDSTCTASITSCLSTRALRWATQSNWPNRMRLVLVEPPHALAWRSEDGNWLWAFELRDRVGKTRLISRNRYRLDTLAARIGMLPMEPASLVMERRMLRGIKRLAEGLDRKRKGNQSPGAGFEPATSGL